MIHPHLQMLLAQARIDDLRRAAAAQRQTPTAGPARLDPSPVTVRFGFPDDADAVATLAELDSATPPPEPLLLAEVDGQLRAALSLTDGSVIADPFRPTTQLAELLRVRARQLRDGQSPSRPIRSRLRRRLVPTHLQAKLHGAGAGQS